MPISKLKASSIASGTIDNARISLDAAEIPSLPTSKITSGTFDDARIAASNVSQHATSFDDNKLVNDLSTLGLRVHTQENLSASNTNSQYIDVFQDDSGYTNGANTARSINEYISSVQPGVDEGGTLVKPDYSGDNNNGSPTYFDMTPRMSYGNTNYSRFYNETPNGGGIELGMGASYNFIAVSKQVLEGNFILQWQIENRQLNDVGTAPYNSGDLQSYNVGIMPDSGVINNGSLINGGDNIKSTKLTDLIVCSYRGTGADQTISIWKNNGSSTNELIQNVTASLSYQDILKWIRKDGLLHLVHVPNGGSATLLHSVSSSFFNNTNNNVRHLWSVGGNASATTHYQHIQYRQNSTNQDVVGENASATGNFTCPNITASSATTKMGAVITYQDNAGTNALNTDIVLQLSADGGSNYSTATLTALPDFSTGIKMAKVNDLAVTSGTSLKYKILFANQSNGVKEARIRGVSLNY